MKMYSFYVQVSIRSVTQLSQKSVERRLAIQPLLDLHVGASMQDQQGWYMYMYIGHVSHLQVYKCIT